VVDDIPTPSDPPRAGSALMRVIWMVSIPFMLLCIPLIAEQPKWTLGSYDLVLVLLVLLAIVARAVDILRFGGTTATSEPADRSHLMGYSVGLVLIAGVAWFFAQSAGP
jgi:hypothetical protein